MQPHGDNPIRTALLSFGMSGKVFHAPLLRNHPGFRLQKVLQHRSPVNLIDAQVVSDLDDILGDSAIELVIVNTPQETHFSLTLAALRAGKHVVVEKPFTLSAEEGHRLKSIASECGKVLAVFQSRRWDGDFLTVQKVVREGLLGEIVEYESRYDRFRPSVDTSTWKEQAGPGRGILYNLGSHLIDQALTLFGTPQSVDARIGIQRTGGAVDDFYDIRLVYPTHLAILKSSYLVAAQGPRFALHGTAGSFVKFGMDPQEEWLKAGKSPLDSGYGADDSALWGTLTTASGQRRIPTELGNYMGFYENIYQAIRNGSPLAVPAEDGTEVIRVIEACYESNSTGKRVSLK